MFLQNGIQHFSGPELDSNFKKLKSYNVGQANYYLYLSLIKAVKKVLLFILLSFFISGIMAQKDSTIRTFWLNGNLKTEIKYKVNRKTQSNGVRVVFLTKIKNAKFFNSDGEEIPYDEFLIFKKKEEALDSIINARELAIQRKQSVKIKLGEISKGQLLIPLSFYLDSDVVYKIKDTVVKSDFYNIVLYEKTSSVFIGAMNPVVY